jgi:hypothetical protein
VSRCAMPAAWLLVALASLAARATFPVQFLTMARHDDALFMRLAHSLAAGNWLGAFDNLTLAKGMFYPLFIAAVEVAGMPLKLAEQGIYLAVCAAFAWLSERAAGRRGLGLTLFALLAANPVLWHPELARVIREGLYISLSLAVVALAVATAFPALLPSRWRGKVWIAATLLGLAAGGFWLTREEGVWLAPAAASPFVLAVIGGWRGLPAGAGPRRSGRLLRPVLPLGLSAAICLGVVLAVAAVNKVYYGAFITTEFQAARFERAYGAMVRIAPDNRQETVVSPPEARARAYNVSSAAHELAPYLDGPLGNAWHEMGCAWVRPAPCPDIPPNFFMWALRDAVAAAGHYGSAADALGFYKRLANEIDDACRAGRLACLPDRATFAPPFRWRYLPAAGVAAERVTDILFTMGDGVLSVGANEDSWSRRLEERVARLYATLCPPLAAVGIAGTLLALISWRRLRIAPGLTALVLASGLALTARVLLLAYLEATSFQAARILYAAPASGFVLISTVLGIHLGWTALAVRMHGRTGARE